MASDRSFPARKLTGGEKIPRIPPVTVVRARGLRKDTKRRRPGVPGNARPDGRAGAEPVGPGYRSWLSRIVGGRLAAAGARGAGIAPRGAGRAAGVVAAASAGALAAGARTGLTAAAAAAPATRGVDGRGGLPRERQGQKGQGGPGEERGHGRNLLRMWSGKERTGRAAARRARVPGSVSIPPHTVENPYRPVRGNAGRDRPRRSNHRRRVGQGDDVGSGAGEIVDLPLRASAARGIGRQAVAGGEMAAAIGPIGRAARHAGRVVMARGPRRGRAAAAVRRNRDRCRTAGVDGGDARGQGCGDGGGSVAATTSAGIACTRGQEHGGDERRGEGRASTGPRVARVPATRRRSRVDRGGRSARRAPPKGRGAAHPAAPPTRCPSALDHGRSRSPSGSASCRGGRGGREDPAAPAVTILSRLEWASRRPRGPRDVRRNDTRPGRNGSRKESKFPRQPSAPSRSLRKPPGADRESAAPGSTTLCITLPRGHRPAAPAGVPAEIRG